MFIIILLLLLIVYIVIVDCLNKVRVNTQFKNTAVGGPKYTLPLFGDIFLGIGLNVTNLSEYIKLWHQKYGKVYRMWYLHKCILFVQYVEYAEMILSSTKLLKKPFFYDQISLWLGDGLLLSNGLKWQKHRRTINQTFNLKIMEQFVEVFDQHCHSLIKKLQPLADGSTVIDVHPFMCSTALDIIVETTMGVKISPQSPEGLVYLKALESVLDIISERFLKFIQYFNLLYKLLSYKSYRTLQKNIQILHTFREKIINERRGEMLKSFKNNENNCKTNGNELHDMGFKKRLTLLDMLLQTTIDGQPLSNKAIQEEVDTFIFGGHDTIGSALSFILYTLAQHPQEQERVFEEIFSIMGADKSKSISMKDLQKMKYLECVIKEGIRLYPPGPIIGRETVEDYKVGSKIIPRNTTIIIFIHAICRDPEYFPKPNKFIPERFQNEIINPYAFLPFSAGPRNCLGQKFAMLEMKCIISGLIRHYELLPLGPKINTTILFILRSTTGVNVGLKPRKY